MAMDFNTGVIEEFRANQGKVGGRFEGRPLLLVNTIGAKSGTARTVPLVYYRENDTLYLIASAAGNTKHPAWYHNLIANPEVTIELGADTIPVTISELPLHERNDIWPRLIAQMPQFGDYEKITNGRIIPLMVISPR